MVLVGTNAVVGRDSFTVVKIKQCPVLFIKNGPDGILINASLYDPDSNAVVSIKENKIEALNGERYRARQSQDEGSLTIKNAAGSELFYIRFLNRSTVRFRGFRRRRRPQRGWRPPPPAAEI